MISLDVHFPEVRRVCKNAPKNLIMEALNSAAYDACRITNAWTHNQYFGVRGKCNTVTLSPPQNTKIYEINKVYNEGKKLINDWLSNNDEITIAKRLLMSDHVTLFIAELILLPDKDNFSLPDNVMNIIERVLPAGAISRLLEIPGQSFTDFDMAGRYYKSFEDELMTIKNELLFTRNRAFMLKTHPIA